MTRRRPMMPIAPMPDILERAACHEAGHAATHRHFGRRISYIFITPDGSGITSITQSVQGVGAPRQPAPMVPDHAQLVAVMAGRAAEAIQYPALPRDELVELSPFRERHRCGERQRRRLWHRGDVERIARTLSLTCCTATDLVIHRPTAFRRDHALGRQPAAGRGHRPLNRRGR